MIPSIGPLPINGFLSNPFATRWTGPTRCRFLFPPEKDLQQLLHQLQQHQGWGQVLGPHGSGKSTLVESLATALQQSGQVLARYRLHQGQRRLPMKWSDNLLQHATQIIVDGFEQLSRLARYRLKKFCRKQHKGLLVTTHQSLGLPNLIQLQPNLQTAQRLVAHLQRNQVEVISKDDVGRHFPQHSHNLRELLFCLYDLFEERRLREPRQ